MTQLPNPFLNSVAPYPAATETAAADQVAPQVAAAEPIAVARTDVLQTVGTTVSAHGGAIAEPSMIMEVPEEAPAPRCTEQHEGAGALEEPMTLILAAPPNVHLPDATNHIGEIFHYVRKLMKQPQRFVLDADAFMADVEEEPLFIRDGDHLRRWEA